MQYNEEVIVDIVTELICPIHNTHPNNLAFRNGQIYVDCCCPDFGLLVNKEMRHQVEMQELIYDILSRNGKREELPTTEDN